MIGAVAAVALVPALVDEPLVLSAALALWVGGCLAVSLLDRSPRSYVLMLAGYTAAIIAFPAVDRPEAIFDVASARVTEIILGILCATLTHSLFFPRPVGGVLHAQISAWLDDAGHWLNDCLTAGPGRLTGQLPGQLIAEDRLHLAVDVVEMELLATHLPFDTSNLRETTAAVRALLARMLLLIPLLSGVTDRRLALGAYRNDELDSAQAAIARWVATGAPLDDLPPLRRRLCDLAARHHRPVWSDLLVASLLTRLDQTVATLGECRALLGHLDHPLAPLTEDLREAVALAPAPRFHRDIPFAALSGISAVIAIFACCVLWIETGWADGAGAAVLTAVFCSLFAAQDNPVPAILRFGGSLVAAVPLAAVYVFAVLPAIDGFAQLCLVLAPAFLLLGMLVPHPRYGTMVAMPIIVGLCNAMALQDNFTADFARFLNANLAQLVAVGCAVAVTAAIRSLGADVAITRLLRRVRTDLARLAEASVLPDADAVLARTVDQLAMLTPRLGHTTARGESPAERGLRGLRLAMNLVVLQSIRPHLGRRPGVAVARLLQSAGRYFRQVTGGEGSPPPEPALLGQIDRALSLLVGADMAQPADKAHGLAAMVALRRNLFPQSPAFNAAEPTLRESLA